jgi:uncharacterized protein YhaN
MPIVMGIYFAPLFMYALYAIRLLPSSISWQAVSLGLMITFCGTALLTFLLAQRESAIRAEEGFRGEQAEATDPSEGAPQFDTMEYRGRTENSEPVIQYVEVPAQPIEENPIYQESLERLAYLEESLEATKRGEEQALQALVVKEDAVEKIQKELQKALQQREEYQNQIHHSRDQVGQKESLIHEYQQTISEQRGIIEKKQQYISKLENKVKDLSYEVKTLLQLGDLGNATSMSPGTQDQGLAHPVMDIFQPTDENPDLDNLYRDLPVSSDKRVLSQYDATVHLHKCIDVAKKLTGASHLAGNQSRFLDLSVDSYAIDLRRLIDSLRNENAATILLYSIKENKLLFVNNQIKTLVGWSPEKFMKDFPNLIQEGVSEWKHAVKSLPEKGEANIRMILKTKNNENAVVHCVLGEIPDGVFKDHVVAIFYPA